MNVQKEFKKKLTNHIKQYKLGQESVDSAECVNCGGVVNYYAAKSTQDIKMQACYQCGAGSIQVIS